MNTAKELVAQLLDENGLSDKYTPEHVLKEFKYDPELSPFLVGHDDDPYVAVFTYFVEWMILPHYFPNPAEQVPDCLEDSCVPVQVQADIDVLSTMAKFEVDAIETVLNRWGLSGVFTGEQILSDYRTNPALGQFNAFDADYFVLNWLKEYTRRYSHDERDAWCVDQGNQLVSKLRGLIWDAARSDDMYPDIRDARKISMLHSRLTISYDYFGFKADFRPYKALDYIRSHYPNESLEIGFYYWWVNEVLPLFTEEHMARFLKCLPVGDKYAPKHALWAFNQDHVMAYTMCGGRIQHVQLFKDCWD